MRINTRFEAFKSAIVDGINIYVRDVLVKRGIIPQANADALSEPELVRLKHEIATNLAAAWARMPLQRDEGGHGDSS